MQDDPRQILKEAILGTLGAWRVLPREHRPKEIEDQMQALLDWVRVNYGSQGNKQ